MMLLGFYLLNPKEPDYNEDKDQPEEEQEEETEEVASTMTTNQVF